MHWSELDSGSQSVLRWTLASALIWGAAFAATSVAGVLISDVNPLDHSCRGLCPMPSDPATSVCNAG